MENGEFPEIDETNTEEEIVETSARKSRNIFNTLLKRLERWKPTAKLLDFVKTHRLISVFGGVGIIMLVIALMVFTKSAPPSVGASEEEGGYVQYNLVEIDVPPGAYPSEKFFKVEEISPDSPEYTDYKTLANFEGPIYRVYPSDGKDELALKPLKIRYRLDPQLYPGDEFVHFTLRYVTLNEPHVVGTLYGCEVVEKGGVKYLEGTVFHASFVVGISFKKPEYADFGIRLLVDKPPTLKPSILIVPGIDQNFVGTIPNTFTPENPGGSNIWEMLFPDRPIWVYKYPLLSTKPRNYMRAFERHQQTSPVPTYIDFEARRLAEELERLNRYTFDIIAHDIGGLIVRYALESNPRIKNVRSVVLVSTPNTGTNVTNPLYFSTLYGKPPDIIAEAMGGSRVAISFITTHILSTFEKVNTYWREILPTGLSIRKLESFNVRKDIRYLCIAGSTPPIETGIKGTELEKFYPELTDGEGDGFVSVKSALMEESKNLMFPYSFTELYLKGDVLNAIKDFLNEGIKLPKVPEFKTDEFVETKVVKRKEEKPRIEPWKKYLLPELKKGRILKSTWKLSTPDLGEPYGSADGWYYLVVHNGVYVCNPPKKWTRILDGEVVAHNFYNDSMIVVTNERVEVLRRGKIVDSWPLPTFTGNVLDAWYRTDGRGIMLVDVEGRLLLYFVKRNEIRYSSTVTSTYARLRGERAEVFLITESSVSSYDIETFKKKWTLNTSMMMKRLKMKEGALIRPIDVVRVGRDLFVLFKDYIIGVFDLYSYSAQVVAYGELGSKRLMRFGDFVLAVGENTLGGFDYINKKRIEFYQIIKKGKIGMGYKEMLISYEEGGRFWLEGFSIR
ncbi:MAG: hypothetical protein J7L52_08265 [Thermotogae bacterium]|nr:hypothetical protein [Thermotogota bacterium]